MKCNLYHAVIMTMNSSIVLYRLFHYKYIYAFSSLEVISYNETYFLKEIKHNK